MLFHLHAHQWTWWAQSSPLLYDFCILEVKWKWKYRGMLKNNDTFWEWTVSSNITYASSNWDRAGVQKSVGMSHTSQIFYRFQTNVMFDNNFKFCRKPMNWYYVWSLEGVTKCSECHSGKGVWYSLMKFPHRPYHILSNDFKPFHDTFLFENVVWPSE